MHLINSCEEKRRGFKYISVMNVIMRNQNLEEAGILERYFYLESFGISRSDKLNLKIKTNRSSLPKKFVIVMGTFHERSLKHLGKIEISIVSIRTLFQNI